MLELELILVCLLSCHVCSCVETHVEMLEMNGFPLPNFLVVDVAVVLAASSILWLILRLRQIRIGVSLHQPLAA